MKTERGLLDRNGRTSCPRSDFIEEIEMAEEIEMDVLAETENFAVWRSQEGDDYLYHIELGGITMHLTSEEWDELVVLIKDAD